MFGCGDVGLILLGVSDMSSAADSVKIPSRWASAVSIIKAAGLDVGDFASMVTGLPDGVVNDLLDKIKSDFNLDCEVF